MDKKDTKFKPGQSGNPNGRPKGSFTGRTLALNVLDSMLSKEGNQGRLRDALQEEFDKSPVKFFKTFVMPLLPKNVSLSSDEGNPFCVVVKEKSSPGSK